MCIGSVRAISFSAAVALCCIGATHAVQARTAELAGIQLANNYKNQRHHRAPQALGPIACTKLGCHHIPAGCHPEMTYDFAGNPTGYEIAVCPDGRG
jgi:hypothetical protein